MSPLLQIEDLVVRYDDSPALRGVSMTIGEGEIVAVLGANGAGKSTTLRAISGLNRPSRGRIRYRGEEITGMPAEMIVRRGISHVPEGRRLFAGLSVLDNLEMGAVAARRAEWRSDVEDVFTTFPVLRQRRHQLAWSLSGGEQQMLTIGRALMARPRVLLLDEPSLGLAPLLVREVFKRIVEINRGRGTTVLLAEQNARMALQVAHRGVVLTNGRVVLEDDTARLRADSRVEDLYLGGVANEEDAGDGGRGARG